MGTKGNSLLQRLTVWGMIGFVPLHAALAAPPSSHRLDLRPPTALLDNAAAKIAAFPNMLHRQSLSTQQDERFAGFNAALPQVQGQSRIEEIARRVHREGLPVARLWENHSALVSLGLNQRGKPGLWIVQKLH